MLAGEFCFINNRYYKDFSDQNLMRNKEAAAGKLHNRPCFFCFSDSINADIYWLVPASSRYDKYKKIYDRKVQRYGHCKTIEKSIQQESQSLTARLLTAKNQAEYLNSERTGKICRERDEPEK